MIPVHAVGGAAGAVGGMADSGIVHTMTRGRLWIAVLGLLLGGIVALNVWGLSLSASTTGTAGKIDELERSNSVLAAKIAKRSSSDRVQRLAAGLGLETPTPKAVRYLKARDADPAKAADRLNTGAISALDGLAIAPAFAETSTAPDPAPAPAATGPSDPIAPQAASPEPPTSATSPEVAQPPPVEPAPAAPAGGAPAAGGGVTP